jgi:hypothetical protein
VKCPQGKFTNPNDPQFLIKVNERF